MELMDMDLSAPMAAVRVELEVRNLHHKVRLVVGIDLMYNMSI